MKITNIRLRKLEGALPEPPFPREERGRQPADVYPEFKSKRVPAAGHPAPEDRLCTVTFSTGS